MYVRQHGLEQNLFLAPGEGDTIEEGTEAEEPSPSPPAGLLRG
jgi:hypothetical protein